MKPSERVEAIFQAGVALWRSSGRQVDNVVGAALRVASVEAYLDEQHELERRRRAFARAFTLVHSAHTAFTVNRVNAELYRASLTARVNAEQFWSCFHVVLEEAEREGLL